MFEKTFEIWLPMRIRITITTIAMRRRMRACSTMPWPSAAASRSLTVLMREGNEFMGVLYTSWWPSVYALAGRLPSSGCDVDVPIRGRSGDRNSIGWGFGPEAALEAVAETGHADDVLRLLHIRLDLFAQATHVGVDGAGLNLAHIPPDILQHPLSADDLPRMRGEVLQQPVLERAQPHRVTVQGHSVLRRVDHEVAEMERLVDDGADPVALA